MRRKMPFFGLAASAAAMIAVIAGTVLLSPIDASRNGGSAPTDAVEASPSFNLTYPVRY